MLPFIFSGPAWLHSMFVSMPALLLQILVQTLAYLCPSLFVTALLLQMPSGNQCQCQTAPQATCESLGLAKRQAHLSATYLCIYVHASFKLVRIIFVHTVYTSAFPYPCV